MNRFFKVVSAISLLILIGVWIRMHYFRPNAVLNREERMTNSIVLNSVYCNMGKNIDFVIRMALMDYLAFGGEIPKRDSSSDLLLVYLKGRSSSEAVEDFFEREFNSVDSVLRENCSIGNSYGTIMMIAGGSPLVTKDYSGASDCKILLGSIEREFVRYVWD